MAGGCRGTGCNASNLARDGFESYWYSAKAQPTIAGPAASGLCQAVSGFVLGMSSDTVQQTRLLKSAAPFNKSHQRDELESGLTYFRRPALCMHSIKITDLFVLQSIIDTYTASAALLLYHLSSISFKVSYKE
jgi:hypothetical protein